MPEGGVPTTSAGSMDAREGCSVRRLGVGPLPGCRTRHGTASGAVPVLEHAKRMRTGGVSAGGPPESPTHPTTGHSPVPGRGPASSAPGRSCYAAERVNGSSPHARGRSNRRRETECPSGVFSVPSSHAASGHAHRGNRTLHKRDAEIDDATDGARASRRAATAYRSRARYITPASAIPGIWNTDSGEVECSSERSDVARSVPCHGCRNGSSRSYS